MTHHISAHHRRSNAGSSGSSEFRQAEVGGESGHLTLRVTWDLLVAYTSDVVCCVCLCKARPWTPVCTFLFTCYHHVPASSPFRSPNLPIRLGPYLKSSSSRIREHPQAGGTRLNLGARGGRGRALCTHARCFRPINTGRPLCFKRPTRRWTPQGTDPLASLACKSHTTMTHTGARRSHPSASVHDRLFERRDSLTAGQLTSLVEKSS